MKLTVILQLDTIMTLDNIFKKLLTIITLLTLCTPVQAEHPDSSKNSITWLNVHWPPLMILHGKSAGQGRLDKSLALYKQYLPNITHLDKEMNWARFWSSIADKKNLCTALLLKTSKHEKLVHYSSPVGVSPTHRIYMKRENINKLGNPETISLRDLISDIRFKTIIEKDRSYTPKIDAIIKQTKGIANYNFGITKTVQLIKMLAKDRINYLIAYPSVFAHINFNNQISAEIGSIGITEVDPYTLYYIGCTKNSWGEKNINEINKMLKVLLPLPEYRGMVGTLLNEPTRSIIQEAYRHEVLGEK